MRHHPPLAAALAAVAVAAMKRWGVEAAVQPGHQLSEAVLPQAALAVNERWALAAVQVQRLPGTGPALRVSRCQRVPCEGGWAWAILAPRGLASKAR